MKVRRIKNSWKFEKLGICQYIDTISFLLKYFQDEIDLPLQQRQSRKLADEKERVGEREKKKKENKVLEHLQPIIVSKYKFLISVQEDFPNAS